MLLLALLLAPLALGAAVEPAEDHAWWRDTALDSDRDGLDDALAPLLAGTEPLTVILDYARMPTPRERAAAEAATLGIVFAPENFPILVARAMPADVPRLRALPGVVLVEANDVLSLQLRESVPLIGAPTAWTTYGVTGEGVVVAVLDDGAYEQHPDFRGKVAASYNAGAAVGPFSSTPASSVVAPARATGHGTHVAGTTVGAGEQSNGVYKGVAPGARFVDVQVFAGGNETTSDIVLRGLDWVISNRERLDVRVVSVSLGGRASDGRDALSRGVDIAVDKGLVVVAAAGNQGPRERSVPSPGAAEKAITVGAVDKRKALAEFSSRGPTLDGRTKPDLVAPGVAVTSTIPPASTTSASGFLSGKREVYYGALSGTSMAAPHVSGVVALMLEANPDLSPAQVKRILLATAQDIDAEGVDNRTGFGFVNAAAAVQVAREPELLESARFRDVLAKIPDPAPEGLLERLSYEVDGLRRSGALPVLAGWGLLAALLVVLGLAYLARPR